VFEPAVGGGDWDDGFFGDGGGGVEREEVDVHLCCEAFWDVGGGYPAGEGEEGLCFH